MCGIHALIALVDDSAGNGDTAPTHAVDGLPEVLRDRLARRGPDHLGQVSSSFTGRKDRKPVSLQFTSTVLALRGDGLTKQPLVDTAADTGRVLCWNGEVWKWKVSGEHGRTQVEVDGNDGQHLFERLAACSDTDAVLAVLRAIEGPFAFVYYDRPAGRLFYGRDRLGRRSLLERRTGRSLTLSSVSDMSFSSATEAPWVEVEADGIYVVDLLQDRPFAHASSSDDAVDGGGGGTTRYDWSKELGNDSVSGLGHFNMAADPPPCESRLTLDSPSVRELRDQLTASLRLRVRNVPRPPSTSSRVHPGTDRVDTRIAVLFSGGLDCTVLARLAHDLLPADQGIDLINVAFENPRVVAHLAPEKKGDIYEACPDRVTGRASLAELERACPQRAWRFVAVNVPYAETVAHRPEIVALMHPHNTEMDLSIASALYFASRAGVDDNNDDNDDNDDDNNDNGTSARVLVSGLGADELFGGYGRHAVAFGRDGSGNSGGGGYGALARELLLDMARLGRRNLGRDDRVLAHWGREVRFPFLDDGLVPWALALPVWAKCDFANRAASGDDVESDVEPAKRVLRLVALSLGMPNVAREKKRAIQFGARTAKMESGRVKGTALVV
ncbi:uncharacterized protein SPSK_10695 [Sporothrix schenckii 1099-18]|uniref:Glutamine amidotransferase type-2 domain-containing protein n=2 Tax=Sporothrix schenckii TaxID=29908 RepID=U7PL12_SPOS1|nr:uncharacterized protein SPSK_10695 [Sporothrix schenckii 1099-18]ERS95220.1 hypothetical protein HMPREF1624_08431 [Sporothrix schenckii ATCC 58251]KJR90018.1 hypothetical protein SPSK_10695 [Sporothrix schenckii 1099-18]